MRYYLAGEDIVVPVKLKLDGNYVTPEPGTVNYTVRDNAGNVIPTLDRVPLETDNTTSIVNIELPSAHTGISKPQFENRTIIVRFKARGQAYAIRHQIRLVPFINMAVTEAEVRSVLGMTDIELPDHDIDLYKAYFTLENAYGKARIEAALESGDTRSISLNKAIVLQAAVDLIPSLRLRAVQEEQASETRFARFLRIDFEEISRSLRTQLATEITLALDLAEELPLFFTTTSQPDPITGGA